MSPKTRNVPPRAGAMLESLRGLGYTTAAALADVIDNSISAGATQVDVSLAWEGPSGEESRILVLDNGRGMFDAELESAMRLGDKSPLDTRSAGDLGRFGMGLKTASFSQCRRLTVASVKEGSGSCLRWDLDALASNPDGGWLIFDGPAFGSESLLEPLASRTSGTLVLWEVLDRIVTAGFDVDDFNELVDAVEAHLAMVFHRLIEGPRPQFRLTLNGIAVQAWDPFLTGHPAKSYSSPVEKIPTASGEIAAQGHVLPHKDMLTPEEFDKAAGPAGWSAQQGFYVYRNERLLVAGGWLGLGQGRPWNREESHRLARIRLDIPNTADAAWKIDIRKSTARPPAALRGRLTQIAEDARRRARNVFAFRGTPTVGPGKAAIEQAWRVEHLKSGIRYKVDEGHPAIAAVLETAGSMKPMILAMLRVIEETVPVQRIWLDTAENRDTPKTGFADAPPAAVASVIGTIFADMVGRRGMSHESARQALLRTEPFQNFPALVATVAEQTQT